MQPHSHTDSDTVAIPTRRVTPIRRALRAIAVVLVGLSAFAVNPITAQAQTSRVLVSNTGQGSDASASTSSNTHGQLFHTGASTAGWTLTSVTVVSEDQQGDAFAVDICDAAVGGDEFPTTTCTTVTAPSTFAAGGITFTHAGLDLDGNSNYVVVITSTANVELDATNSGGEDSGGLSSWSIKGNFYWNNGTVWANASGSRVLQITVNGYEKTALNVSSIAFTSAPGADRNYGIGEDIEATVTFNAAVDITGTPQVGIQIGGSSSIKQADCATATNTTTMVCSYTVVENDPTSAGLQIQANSVSLNGGTIYATGTTTDAADLDHNALALNTQHRVDAIRPLLILTGTDAPQMSGDGATILLTFDEIITLINESGITIKITENGSTRTATTTVTALTGTDLAQRRTVELNITGAPPTSGATVTVALNAGTIEDKTAGNDNAALPDTAIVNQVSDAQWAFTLTDAGGNHVTEIVEGESATATVRITNSTRFTDPQTITLTWGTSTLPTVDLEGAAGLSTITIPAMTDKGTLVITAPQQGSDIYKIDQTHPLTATHRGVPIGSIILTRSDDEPRPTLSISKGGTPDYVEEGHTVEIEISLDIGSPVPGAVKFTVSDPGGALTGPIPSQEVFAATEKVWILTLDVTENTTQNDGARPVTVTLQPSTDARDPGTNARTDVPYILGSVTSVSFTVFDNDTRPAAPANLSARPGDQQVTLSWNLPSANDIAAFSRYEVRYTTGNTPGGTWTAMSGATRTTTSHTITGLTNDNEYTFEVRSVNVGSGEGQTSTVMATPRDHGVFISDTSIREGESATITIIPEGGPSFDSVKQLIVVVASRSGPDQAKNDSDFTVAVGSQHLGFQLLPFEEFGFTGRHPHHDTFLGLGESEITVTLNAVENTVSECREDVSIYAYLDYATNAQNRVPANGSEQIQISDDDTRPELENTVVNGRTVTLTFSTAMSLIPTPDEAGENPNPAEHYFTLVNGPGQSVGETARSFQHSGRTVTLTFAEPIGENKWLRYDRFSKWAPLGKASGGRCASPLNAEGFMRQITDIGGGQPTTALAALTIADAQGHEGPDANVNFTVTLTPASTEVVLVDYRTAELTIEGAATSGEDFTPTSGRLEFTPGQTRKTIRVPIVDDTVEDDGETFLLDLYNASGATMVDTESWATGTIRNTEDEEPTTPANTLTASFANVPPEHGGGGESNRFTFDLSFSENPEVGYAKLRDHAFTITGGNVKKAQRKVRGSNQSWTITVEPEGWGDVGLTLPGGRACTANNAICTADNRQLSNSPSATIRGPAALSVADASANENTDSGLEFAVTLDRSSTLTVTVDYATSNGTATAGQDYTATSGTLSFSPGDTAKTVTVPVLNDAIDDGIETMTLTLSNASNARIADGSATGTIENSDPLQQAWIARFGRTVASDVVDGITDRLSTARSGSEVRIAGVTLERNGATWTEAPAEGSEITDALKHERALKGRDVSPDELLLNSSFHLQGESDGPGGTAWAAWGRFSQTSFEGEADGVTLSGDVTTGLLGADVGTEEWTAGVALSSAKGDGPFSLTGSEKPATCDSGTVESALTSVHPYAQVSLSDDVDAWAIGGYGTGDMTIEEEGCSTYKTDIDMTMAAVGLRGQILAASAGDALDMAVRTDALWLRTSSDKTEGLEAAKASVTRLRLMIDAGRSFTTAGGATLTPTIEAGIRHDAGDAEEGVGFEIGGGLTYQGAGITIEGKVRTLVAHDDSAYEEWGASASVRIDPGSDGRGMSLSITPTWGSAASEAEQLWSTRTAEDLVGNAEFEAERRLDAELGYGLGGPYGWGTLTPYGGLTLADGAQRTMRTGLRWKASQSATIGLEATREDGGTEEKPTNAVMLRAQLRF